MQIKFYFVKLFLIVLLLSMGIANKANAQLPAPGCSTVYQSTSYYPFSSSGHYDIIRTVSTENGAGGNTIYNGYHGRCYNAITGEEVPAGSILTDVAALAYDGNSNRIYFVNNDRR